MTSNYDFSGGVTAPGAGGSINPSTAMSGEMLAKLNASGKKWRPNPDGSMSNHRETMLEEGQRKRQKRFNLVNRTNLNSIDSGEAMNEIFARRKLRAASYQEHKKAEYSHLFAEAPAKKAACTGKNCTCDNCETSRFREWSDAQRKALTQPGAKGEFAGPGMSFPIASEKDVSNAWASAGRAKSPRSVMSEVIRIAKKYGWEDGLPESVKTRIKVGESGLPHQ